jgi:hypothetical protein
VSVKPGEAHRRRTSGLEQYRSNLVKDSWLKDLHCPRTLPD